jgi:NADH dehydrogenase
MVSVPFGLAAFKARFLELLPNPLLTVDQVELLKFDNVVSDAAVAERRTFAGLGITPVAVEAELESYLWRFRPRGQFERRPA